MNRARSSKQLYRLFVEDHRQGRIGDEKIKAPKLSGRRRAHLREYAQWLKPHRAGIALAFALAVAVAGLNMVEPLFMRHIIDRILLNPSLDASARVFRLNVIGALFLVLFMVLSLLNALREFHQRLLNTRVTLLLRRALFDRLLRLPLPKLWDMKTGGILSRLTGDVETTTGLMQMAISPAVSLIRLSLAVFILLKLNWRLGLTALALVPGVMAISFILARRVRPIYRSMRRDAEHIDGRVGEVFSGIRVVRAFQREVRETLGYLLGQHTVLRKAMFAQRREMAIWTTWNVILGMVNVAIVWYGGHLYVLGKASIGDIMTFQWYTFLLLNPVMQIVNSFSELQRLLAAMERVFEMLGAEEDKPDRPDAVDVPSEAREICFENVEFEYREGRPAVRDFSVTVPSGSVVALVGRSGAGKTTVTDLVARFHDPTRGRILLSGTDIRQFRLRSYRSLLAVVQQDTFLFDGSVRENIAYGRPIATDAEVEDAARRANAHEFIVRMPEGYDTFVGERGVKLSAGQQQRLSIARAILASPKILILDEATSNLDTESEQLIQASMASLLAGRTTFVITHRLSTVRRADLILLLQDGQILERGTHEDLMAARGVYHEMVSRQMERHSGEEVLH